MFFCRGPLEDKRKVSNFFNATFETTDTKIVPPKAQSQPSFGKKIDYCVLLIIYTLSLLW